MYRYAWSARAIGAVMMIATCVLGGVALPAASAELDVRVTDAAGAPLADAVVELAVAGTQTPTPSADGPPPVIRQVEQRFVPEVLAVRSGTAVTFPNDDPMMHHVYSLSSAKTFELPLYGNKEVPAITFDRAGVVKIGCNIHDHMRAYVYVSDAYAFAVTGADGTAGFTALPAGEYTLTVWQPRLRDTAGVAAVRVDLRTESAGSANVALDVYPPQGATLNRFERGGYD